MNNLSNEKSLQFCSNGEISKLKEKELKEFLIELENLSINDKNILLKEMRNIENYETNYNYVNYNKKNIMKYKI